MTSIKNEISKIIYDLELLLRTPLPTKPTREELLKKAIEYFQREEMIEEYELNQK